MDAQLPDAFFDCVDELLPPQPKPGQRGGRPRIDNRAVLRVIWFVLTVGCRWKDVPRELGCSGETARSRLQAWQEQGLWPALHQRLLDELNRRHLLQNDVVIVDSAQVRAFGGGDRTGPSPTNRRKPGMKLTLLVDRQGTPLTMQAAAANTSDHRQILSSVIAFPIIRGRRGRPRTRPQLLLADAGYDCAATRLILHQLNVTPLIRRRGCAHGSGLGRIRWVVERTFSWLFGLRRLRTRYDRHPTILDAWIHLAQAVICFQILTRHTTQ
jgi:transposase